MMYFIHKIQTELTLEKKVLFGYVSIPCISGIGSCQYDDLCTLCKECGCPLKAVCINRIEFFFSSNFEIEILG